VEDSERKLDVPNMTRAVLSWERACGTPRPYPPTQTAFVRKASRSALSARSGDSVACSAVGQTRVTDEHTSGPWDPHTFPGGRIMGHPSLDHTHSSPPEIDQQPAWHERKIGLSLDRYIDLAVERERERASERERESVCVGVGVGV
jgi:hypothetical protein